MNVRVNVNKKNKKRGAVCRQTVINIVQFYVTNIIGIAHFFLFTYCKTCHVQESIESFELSSKIYYCENLVIFPFIDRERGLLGMLVIE
jgi:hypothetical protein